MKVENERLQRLIEPVVGGLECSLWGIEYLPQGNHSILRIFIDSPNGVDIQDCERISRQISSVLDVEDPLDGKYVLEVSSPGMDRRLFTLAQFTQFTGSKVKVNLCSPLDGRKKYAGQLCGVEDGNVVVRIDEHEYLLPFEGIDRASIIPDFS